jgi:predicted acyl esterase
MAHQTAGLQTGQEDWMRHVVIALLLAAAVMAAYQYEEVWMPMRDSILLKTDIYYPDSSGPPWPTVLWRSPYGGLWPWWATELLTDSMGYVVVRQYMRGWQGSQGEKTLFTADGWGVHQDGYDAIEWIAAQSWSNDKVCMMGQSAMGIAQYLAAGAAPPHLVCCCPDIAYLNPYLHGVWPGGEFRKGYLEVWCTSQGTPYFVDTVCNHPNYDSMFILMNLAERWDSAAYPMFHIGGWYDMHLEGALSAYPALQARFHNQKLLVGPWNHTVSPSRQQGALTYPTNAALPERERYRLMWFWYDHWMNDSVNGITEPKVCFYLMGDCDTGDTTRWNYWYEADTWPLPEVVHRAYYLREGGLLDTLPPSVSAVDTFLYDPVDPCTSYGGKESWGLTHGYGPQDQRPIEGRSDVLVFETPELDSRLAVIGNIRCVLHAASDRYDTDWTVRVTDVYPDGRSMLITDGILMARHRHGFDREDSLVPGVPDTFDIDVGSTANVFAPGHRLRVIISSSNYPRFEKNPNTGAPFQRNPTECLVATQHIYRSADLPSHLVLPVHPGLSGLEERAEGGRTRAESVTPTIVRGMLLQRDMTDFGSGKSDRVPGPLLLDAAGRKVMELQPGLNDVRHLAPGVYFMRQKETDRTTKVVVQN